ncbi:MAG: PKD domain-containing protein, partial [Prolixibacteraceae bacterium]|nr:PKD domain-containing protein [Prolixibacteraceae bacterium]
GTYYLQVYPFSAYTHGSYHLTNEFIPALLPNDAEPNNTAEEAIEFPMNSDTTGRINYVYNTVADNVDWYKITIPEEGTLKVISTSPDCGDYYIKLVDVNKESLLSRAEIYPLGDVDSVYKTNLQAGTYYLQVYPFSAYNHGSYHLTNEFIPALLPNDSEPNNTAEEANLIVPDTSLTGRLNYILNGVADTDDWYKFTIKQPGGIKIVSSSPDNGDYFISILDTDSNTVFQTVNVYPLGKIGTIYRWGLQAGATYFIHIYRYTSNFGSYYLDVEFQPMPISSFEAVQSLSTVLFTNTSKYATSYLWDFGDGSTSNQVNPSHTYTTAGAFEVTLTATNPNGDVEYSQFVEFRGIQKVEGKHGGNTGSSTVTVYAGGLKPECIPILRKGGVDLTGENIIYPNTGQVQAVFDLRGAELGVYDVVVKNPGEPEMVLSNAYTVEVGNDPEMYVELVGRNRALLNRWSTYTVEFGNKGNSDAYYQILWLAVPDSVEFKNLKFDLDLYNDPEVESFLADCPPYWELDTLDNAPFNGRLYGIPLNKVPADSKYSIEFKIKAFENFQISTFTTNPWFEVDGVGGLKSYKESEDIATMSYNECVAWAIATLIRDKAVGALTGLIPGADCFYNSVKSISEVTLSYQEGKLTVPSLAWNLSQVVWSCLKDVGKNIPWVKAMEVSKIMIDITIDIVNSYSADQECQKFKKKDSKDKNVAAVTSLDPNEIVGPAGFEDENYISSPETSYKIYFENKNTASANALEVWVIDTIDINKFDMSTFKFDNIWIAGNNYEVIEDSASFGLNVDLRPQINTIVRVNGTVNRESGIVQWHFLSLDPSTMDITEDPDAGFLPPNNTSPEGEGFVGYSITLNETVVHNNTISAQAKITFDFNEPIYTNIYSNTIDREAPVSNVYEIKATEIENVNEIFWQGSDDKSGIDYFNIYKSEDGGEFILWNSANENLSDTLRMDKNKSYRFFSQAVDKLGNVEPYKGYSELTVGINDIKQNVYGLSIYPNPLGEESILKYSIRKPGNISIYINNMSGQILKIIPAKYHASGIYEIPLVSSEFAEGIYTISVKGDSGISVSKFVVN